ncbi:MAG: DUF167 domain-containing protein [Pirellulaceae bacterium]
MSVALRETDGGVILPVKVAAGARKREIRGVQNGALKIAVTAVAEKGKANKAVIELLAEWLDVPKSAIEIVSGSTASQKQLSIALPLQAVQERVNSF